MDIGLYESSDLNGGDISIQNGDIYATQALWTQIYLALFGGNPEQSTTDDIEEGTQRYDYWGNSFLQSNTDEQINSITERTLQTASLNSAGRLEIQRAVQSDLSYLSTLATVDVVVTIPKINVVNIDITVQEPDSLDSNQFRIIWNATRTETINDVSLASASQWILANGIWEDIGRWIDSEKWNDN